MINQNSAATACFWFVFKTSGRIDRKIEFPLPDEKTKRRIFQIHTWPAESSSFPSCNRGTDSLQAFAMQFGMIKSNNQYWLKTTNQFVIDHNFCVPTSYLARGKMTLADDVNLEEFVVSKEPTGQHLLIELSVPALSGRSERC